MKTFTNGVGWYAKFEVDPEKFAVFFPEGAVCCGYCPMAYADGLNRPVCRFSRRIIEQPLFSPNAEPDLYCARCDEKIRKGSTYFSATDYSYRWAAFCSEDCMKKYFDIEEEKA